MSFAHLEVATEVLERLLHLEEPGIRISGASAVSRVGGGGSVTFLLAGEGLPNCKVHAVVRRLEDGREILEKLEPVTPAPPSER